MASAVKDNIRSMPLPVTVKSFRMTAARAIRPKMSSVLFMMDVYYGFKIVSAVPAKVKLTSAIYKRLMSCIFPVEGQMNLRLKPFVRFKKGSLY